MPTIAETIKALETLKKEVPMLIGTEAVTFFKKGFRLGGFTDNRLVMWQKGYKSAGATLVKFGHLRDSIQIISLSPIAVTVGSMGIRYAKLHNEGAILQLTPKQRKFFWAKYYELVGKNKTSSGASRTGKAAEVRNVQALMYKRLALSKTLKFPKREFIGESKQLEIILSKVVANRFKDLLP
jgi:phage gpG-like protein